MGRITGKRIHVVGSKMMFLSQWRPGFMTGSIHVGFVVDKVVPGQVSLRVTCFSPVYIIPHWLFILIYHLGDEQQARW
jgi:hypothetical protein